MKTEGKKLNLEDIQVQSFVTTLDRDDQKEIKGGSGTGQKGTDIIVFCRP